MRKKKGLLIGIVGWLALLPAMAPGSAFASAVYSYVGANYSHVFDNCTPPGDSTAGPCVTYTSSMHASGSFTLDTPLPPNFGPADISGRSDLKWSFSDGINTYSSTDTAHVWLTPGYFIVKTDAAGVPIFSGTSIAMNLWQTTPGVNNFYDALDIGYRPYSPPPGDYANTGWICFQVDGNVCVEDSYGPNIANVASAAEGTWSVAVSVSAPLLGPWALVLLLGALGLIGGVAVRRRATA